VIAADPPEERVIYGERLKKLGDLRRWKNAPDFPIGLAEKYWNATATAATQCRSNPISARNLPETGIF
jgi:hypothetical protein